MKTKFRSYLERIISYGVAGLAVVGLVFFLTKVDKEQKLQIEKKIQELKSLNDQIDATNKDFEQRKIQIDEINKQITARQSEVLVRFERLLEKSENYTKFIEQVQRKAKSMDITILNSSYTPPSPAEGAPASYLEFRFILDITGSYERMKNFLWELENTLSRLVKISKMVIKPPLCDKEGNMSMTLTLSTYFLP